jgi:hypothetical protein
MAMHRLETVLEKPTQNKVQLLNKALTVNGIIADIMDDDDEDDDNGVDLYFSSGKSGKNVAAEKK